MTETPMFRDVSEAANGAAAITRLAKDDQDAALLAYVAVYACGFTGKGTDLARYRNVVGCPRDEAFVAQLYRDVPDTVEVTDWKVTGLDGDRVFIAKDGMRAFISSEELVGQPEVGDSASFTVPALWGLVMPGFVARMGSSPLVERSTLSRLYLNIKPAAASWALGNLARRLDDARIPYEMKVLANPRAYLRRDSGVLYVSSEHEDQAVEIVKVAQTDVPEYLMGRAGPRLTGRVAPGVSLAHEPSDISADGLSHGQWVSRLFWEAAKTCDDGRAIAERVRDLIAQAGRDPRQPYLRGSGRQNGSQ